MTSDPLLFAGLVLAILFLAFLVWLMLRAASQADWSAISQGVKSERKRREQEHGR